MKTGIPAVLITFSLLCFGLSPRAKALLPAPPPDGGYPGANTAEGDNALHDINTALGINNTAVGANALAHDTTGQYNVAVGSGALASNTTGNFNMAIGTEALTNNNATFNLAIGFRVLFMNTTGAHLTGIGAAALRNNTTAGFNTAIGADAMRENTTGENNTAIGADALSSNTTGHDNTANGFGALFSNTTGRFNIANGPALGSNTTGWGNTGTGFGALGRNTTGNNNTADGALALGGGFFAPQTGSDNTAVGDSALVSNETGNQNTAIGSFAMEANERGSGNTAIGIGALSGNVAGSNNIALGIGAGGNTEGDNNIDIGNIGVAPQSNTIRIGDPTIQTATYIAGISGATVPSGVTVIVGSDGHLGTMVSSARFKDEIKSMDNASEPLFALKPVAFRYKKEIDPEGIPQLGLVAEDVEKVNPDLVVRDKDGKPYSVRYDQVNAMLLNEFLKEHQTVQQQGATIARLEKQVDALTAGLQKVSGQVEASKSALQVVNNP